MILTHFPSPLHTQILAHAYFTKNFRYLFQLPWNSNSICHPKFNQKSKISKRYITIYLYPLFIYISLIYKYIYIYIFCKKKLVYTILCGRLSGKATETLKFGWSRRLPRIIILLKSYDYWFWLHLQNIFMSTLMKD